jgi:hypothetical protein
MPRATGALPPLLLLLASACATIHPSHRDERFVILSSGDFTPQDVQRVREQLEVGLKALERYIGAAPPSKFPIVVKLWSGSGVSHSYHGAGPIELFWVKEMRSPPWHATQRAAWEARGARSRQMTASTSAARAASTPTPCISNDVLVVMAAADALALPANARRRSSRARRARGVRAVATTSGTREGLASSAAD